MIRRTSHAFTLIETLVVVALTALIMLALASVIQYFYNTNATTLLEWQSVATDRAAIERAMANLREASSLSNAATSSLSFTTSVSGTSQSLMYALDSGVLTETGDATATIAESVANDPSTPIFTYYDASGTELMDPIDPTQVTSVLVNVYVNEDSNATGTTLLSGAALRNLAP